MKYLARALARHDGSLRPGMRTTSPVADVDQRFHLDGFAGASVGARAREPSGARADEEPIEADEGDLDPLPPRRPRASRVEPQTSPESQPARVRAAVDPAPEPAPRPRPAPVRPTTARSEAVARERAQVRRDDTRQSPTTRTIDDPAVSPRASERSGEPPALDEPRIADAPASTHPPTVAEPIEIATVRTADRVPAKRDAPRDADALSHAFADLTAWLARSPSPPPDSPQRAELRPPTASPTRDARRERARESEITASTPSPPRQLSIGRIEVEVVAPERPRRAPARTTTSAPRSSSRFGWRQR